MIFVFEISVRQQKMIYAEGVDGNAVEIPIAGLKVLEACEILFLSFILFSQFLSSSR